MFSVFKNINKYAGKYKLLDAFAIFCARLLPYLMVAFIFFYSVYILNIYLFIFSVFSGLVARFVVNEIVHIFYKELRPAYEAKTNILIPVPKNYSFPSGHASFFFGMSAYLLFFNVNLAIAFMAISFLIGTARVFCGVHRFHDILGGFLAGLLSGIAIYYLLTFVKI